MPGQRMISLVCLKSCTINHTFEIVHAHGTQGPHHKPMSHTWVSTCLLKEREGFGRGARCVTHPCPWARNRIGAPEKRSIDGRDIVPVRVMRRSEINEETQHQWI